MQNTKTAPISAETNERNMAATNLRISTYAEKLGMKIKDVPQNTKTTENGGNR